MAAYRGALALCVRSHGNRQPVKQQCWSLAQVLDVQWRGQIRPLSSASWALVPPNSLRYQNIKQPSLSHPFHHASHSQRPPGLDEAWEETVSLCLLVRPVPGECDDQHTLAEVPLFGQTKLSEILAPRGLSRPVEFLFPMTTVDGSREDDIIVGMTKMNEGEWLHDDAEKRERGSFRRLFETEGCPAPFMYGSRFYCFHCPGMEPLPGYGDKSGNMIGLEKELSLFHTSLYSSYTERETVEGRHSDKEREDEEKLALMYEKLRIELPSFFVKSHDYTMYTNDIEFVNCILNAKTRGRVLYQLSLSLWRLLCLCYYAEARLEVLKLTKHPEDGTIKARWRVRGLPFLSLLLRFYRKDKTDLYRSYDAFSTFYLGHDGLIHCHKVEKMMKAQPPILPRVTTLLAGALVALGVHVDGQVKGSQHDVAVPVAVLGASLGGGGGTSLCSP
uniref:Si:ch211-215a10.4 n=1 Tax=Salmo trutta TaxID=8032 RepID=A0A674DS75_SALTR